MNHPFTPSESDFLTCARCGYKPIDHTDRATCECCSNSGPVEIYIDMLWCKDCIEKEKTALKELKEGESERLNNQYKSTIQVPKSNGLEAVELKTDIFNAETQSIPSLKDEIDKDDSIPSDKKHFALASRLSERHKHLQELISESVSRQRSIQVYLNDLARKLTAEEQEKLKIKDINYQPVTPKITKPSAPKTTKFDKDAIRNIAKKYNVPEAMVKQTMLARDGMSAEDAAKLVKSVMG